MKRAKRHPQPRLHPQAKPRNPVARSPLLGKGGAHGKSGGALRRKAKVELGKLARNPSEFDER
ncbi:MAG: hypothetical protein KGL70_09385 [Betaproteobacteria bacterium]|nr:hypothetical protein [Betaproteobacteria bacterium]MDE2359585.1 hypothetical protein [Betaproteobacteria bacterium]